MKINICDVCGKSNQTLSNGRAEQLVAAIRVSLHEMTRVNLNIDIEVTRDNDAPTPELCDACIGDIVIAALQQPKAATA